MYNMFIIHWDSGNHEHWICPCCSKRISNGGVIPNKDSVIPTFYSYRQAFDNGWRHTKDVRYCPPEEMEMGVWICPDCVKGNEKCLTE